MREVPNDDGDKGDDGLSLTIVPTHKLFNVCNTFNFFFQIRERFRRKILAFLPAAGDGVSTMKKRSELNDSSGNVSLRKIKVMPISMNSKSHESLVKAS